ncbi:MAG: hypothetical protein LDLANPLL_00739 [Turneriella sp.]|nr:hypothetical protein [Turneriella sp.]
MDFFKHSSILFLVFTYAMLWASPSPQSPGLNIEDELNFDKNTRNKKKSPKEEQNNPEDKINGNATTVEGEDEQYAPARKGEIELPEVAEGKLTRWEDHVRDLDTGERKGTKVYERKAQITTEYGSQNALGAKILVTKKDSFGTYLVDYKRAKYDYESSGKNAVANSAYSSDALKLLGQLNFTPSYNMLLRTEYREAMRGLQKNPTLMDQNKKFAIVGWDNLIRPSENQRVTAGVTASIAQASATAAVTQNTQSASMQKIQGSLEWQYIFGERNALTLTTDLWYGENNDYITATPIYYRAGNAEARSVFPLARFLMGENQQALQIDATVGAKVFFAQSMKPLWGPRIAFDFFYPGYQSTLEITRTGEIPDAEKYFFTAFYQAPYRFLNAQDEWKLAFKNNFHITKETHLKVTATLLNYPLYFNRVLDTPNGLLTLKTQQFRALNGSASIAQNFGAYFYHDSGVEAEYFIDNVSLREPFSLFTRLHFTPPKWDFSVDVKYVAARKEIENLTQKETPLSAYTLLGASIEYTLLTSLKIFVRGENLLNQKYQYVSLYQNSTARVWIGLNMVF